MRTGGGSRFISRRYAVMRAWQKVAAATIVVVVASLLPVISAEAKPQPYRPGSAQKEPLVAGRTYTPQALARPQTGQPFRVPAPVWPGRSSVDVVLPSVMLRALGVGAPAQVSGLPVSIDPVGPVVGAVGRVRVESYDRVATAKAGVEGLLLRVSRVDGVAGKGGARVSVDYGGFRGAFGGDWASRLRLRVLPECALTSPARPGCQGRELPTDNDVTAGTATAVVNVASPITAPVAAFGPMARSEAAAAGPGGTLVALSAGSSGGGGDYAATSLAPSATWNGGSNSGGFGWSYPLRVPPSLGGPTPAISLGYSSSGVDGRMASTNNQPSWIGEGFDWQPGAIERRYNGCAEDMGSGANNTVKTGDQCWETDNASLSLSGHAGELIKDGANPNRWHLRNDDGTFVERRTGASNGDNDGEWWVATTTAAASFTRPGRRTMAARSTRWRSGRRGTERPRSSVSGRSRTSRARSPFG